jgi:uncharacterized protein (DUF433 family)
MPYREYQGVKAMVSAIDIGTFIVSTPGVCGGRPRIADTRITVRNIVTWKMIGWTPEKIVSEYEHLSLAQVHAALAYYYANREELDAAFDAEKVEEERIEQAHLARQSELK